MDAKKICKTCDLELDHQNAYATKKGNKVYISSYCKNCEKLNGLNYIRTKRGLITRMYANQIFLSKKRGHISPTYSKQQLLEWLLNQEVFHLLFLEWERSGYLKDFIPSCDRIESKKPYSLENIKIVSWKENRANEDIENISGLIGRAIPVSAIHKKDGNMIDFISISDAARKLSLSIGNISMCCSGRRKSAGGYFWRIAI